MQPKPIRVGAWELQHHVLKPSRCLLQTHAMRLLAALQRPHDFVTFVCSSHPPTPHPPPDDAAAGRVLIHRVLLDAAGVPLRSLVSGPFKEACAETITVHERFDSFDIVRKFLHCEPINMDDVPPELPLVADRWGLTTLFRACFIHAEERSRPHNETPRIHIVELITRFLPIMAIVDVPTRFKTYMAMRMALEMRELNAYFRENPVQIPPLCRDAVCSLLHTDGVHCRRKKSAVLTDDVIPATHVANPSAQPVPDTLDSKLAANQSRQNSLQKTTTPDHDHESHSEQSSSVDEHKSHSSISSAHADGHSTSQHSQQNAVSEPEQKKMQNATPHEQVTAQHSQNGHLDENDVNQSPMLNTSTSSSNDAASEIRDEEFYHTSSGPEAQKDQVSDGPLHQLRDEEDVNNGELSVKQHSHSQSTINPKQVHQSIPGPGASETSQQTVLEKHVREKEAPIFDRASPGDGEGKPIQAQTQTQSGTKASSSKEPILERVGKCPGEDAGTATSGEPSSAQEADTTANDVASETPVEGQGSTQPTSEASQGTPTQTSQEPNSMPIGDGTSSEVSGIGVKKSEPEVAGDHAELDGDRPSGEQPDEVHTGTCDDPDAQSGHEGDENHSGSESVGQTVSATEVEADGRATVDADDNANENGNHDVNTADGTNVDVTTEADGDGDENANVIDEDNADVDAGSSADDHSHADVESDVADSASIAATEEPELPVYEIDPSESEPKEWHKTFDVWNVFHQRNMLDDVIHFMSNYGCDNYIPLLLNVILQQLEPVLSDDEILRLLRKCDWVWEAPALSVLSELGRDWGQRAWRLLACARTGYYGEGKEYHMFWNYVHLAGDIRDRAADVANKGSDSDSETSHSSAPDDGFTASWGQKVADNDFEFTMSLHISDVGEPWDDLSPFYLKIRLVEKEDTEISAENAKRKVTARVNVIESGCGCVLGGKAPKVGTTASSSEGTLIRSVIDGFRLLNGNPSGAGGYSYSVMNGNVLKSWLEKHTRHCGLAFHVRLYVAPSSETSSDTSSESSNGNVECTCGYCECAGCNRENEAEKESVNTENGNDAGSVNYNNS